MKFAAIAYPELANEDFELIQNFRKYNDEQFKLVNPHFTFVFPVEEIKREDFRTEIKLKLQNVSKIPFSIDGATMQKDALSENFHIFLVPDGGFNAMVKLHDQLYSDKLLRYLRFDLPFIPHITIANSTDQLICKKIDAEWNEGNFKISGIVSSVDIVQIQNHHVTTIEKNKLQ